MDATKNKILALLKACLDGVFEIEQSGTTTILGCIGDDIKSMFGEEYTTNVERKEGVVFEDGQPYFWSYIDTESFEHYKECYFGLSKPDIILRSSDPNTHDIVVIYKLDL